MELGKSGLTNVSSNDKNQNISEGIERISNFVKSLVGETTDIKNQFESVASKGTQIAEHLTKEA